MSRVVEERRQLEASVHERVACTTCGQPIGERCVRVGAIVKLALKHPHEARLRAGGLYRR